MHISNEFNRVFGEGYFAYDIHRRVYSFFSMVPKSKFTLMKNDQIDLEPFEQCKVCHRRWHRICALYNKKVCSLTPSTENLCS